MKFIPFIFVFLLLVVSAVFAVPQEKIVRLNLNVTLSVDENGAAKVVMVNPQGSHEMAGVTNGTAQEQEFEFLDIAMLECDVDSVSDIIRNMTDKCLDTDGISFREKYNLKVLNYDLCDQTREVMRNERDNVTEVLNSCRNELVTKSQSLITTSATLDARDLDAQKLSNNKWVYLAVGAALLFGYQYLRDRKERPSGGPASKGMARPSEIKFEGEK